MQKRAGLARAMALSPEVLLFDEPSAGLDPISSRLLDDLILELRDSLGATIVMVTHELASIFAVGDNSVFLDPETKTQIACGAPKRLLAECPDPKVQRFLRRGEIAAADERTLERARERKHEPARKPENCRRLCPRRDRVAGGGGAGLRQSFTFFEVTRKAVVFFEGSVDGLTKVRPFYFAEFRSAGSSTSGSAMILGPGASKFR